MRLGCIRVRPPHELRVAVRVVPEHLLDRGFGVELLAIRPELVGDADDPRGEAGVVGRGGLRHYAVTSSSANWPAVPTGPKSRSSSSTKPLRPAPTVTTASNVNLPTVILQRRWSESAPT